MSVHLNLSTGKFLNSSTLFKLSDALLLDLSSGEIVMSNLLVPRVGVDLFKLASLDLNFAQHKSLTDRVSGNNLVTFTRASTALYRGSDGLIKTAAVNLLKDSVTYSGWGSAGQTFQTNAAISPSGSNDAVKLVAGAVSGGKFSYRSVSTTATNVCSVYVKAGEYTNIQFRDLAASRFYTNFDLSAGSYVGGGLNFISAGIQGVGDGWYRCFVVNSRIGGIAFAIAGYPDGVTVTTSSPNFTGDGTSGIYIWGAQVENGVTPTEWIPTGSTISGAPRFDHDPVTGESLGLLVEEERTNLLTYSAQFDHSAWTKVGSFVSSQVSNAALAPDGTQTAEEYQNLAGVSNNNIHQVVTTSAQKYAFSVYLKAKTPSDVGKSVLIGGHENSTTHLREVVQLPAVWTRFSKTGTTTAGAWSWGIDGRTSGTFNGISVPREVSSFYTWGAQLEVGSFPTSYIPTTSTTVTRAADVVSITGTNFSSWYNQSEGTVFVEASAAGAAGVVEFKDGSLERWRAGFAVDNNAKAAVIVGGVVQTNIVTPDNSTPYNQYHKICIAIAENNLVFAYNGNALLDNSLSVPSVDGMTIGSAIGVPGRINGHVKRLAYFPTPKTEQESIGLTT